jgi:Ulp1 protease family, C-terminal catalytic domain
LQDDPTIDTVFFPFIEDHHWFAVFVCIAKSEIVFAEGFNNRPPPTQLRQYLEILVPHFGAVRTTNPAAAWTVNRMFGPTQKDHYNCGPIALCLLDWQLSGQKHHNWDLQSPDKHRMEMLRRIIQLHHGEPVEPSEAAAPVSVCPAAPNRNRSD